VTRATSSAPQVPLDDVDFGVGCDTELAGRDGAEAGRVQVLTVRDGLIADIRGFDDRDEAAAAAKLFP
jgi:hypothetical protein